MGIYKNYTYEKQTKSFYVPRLSLSFYTLSSLKKYINDNCLVEEYEHSCYSNGSIMNGANGAGHYCEECGKPLD